MKSLVYQSFRSEKVPEWIARCLESARAWANTHGCDYRFIDDEILSLVPDWYRAKAKDCLPIITDLGRLILAKRFLAEGYERVIWLDADVLVFDPQGLIPSWSDSYAFGREIWVQKGRQGELRAYRNVHNAFCMFRRDNPFLDFYIHGATRIIECHEGGLVPQIVGPKFLSAQYNMIKFPLVDQVGMISPLVLIDLINGEGAALELFRKSSPTPLGAVNLSSSMDQRESDGIRLSEPMFMTACDKLLATKGEILGG